MVYKLAPRAAADLDEIDHFVTVQMRNPVGARIVGDYLFDAFAAISGDPPRRRGHLRPDITDNP